MHLPFEHQTLEQVKQKYPEKFATESQIFRHIRRGARLFIGTGCGEPQYLVQALTRYVESHPKAIYEAEVFHVWTLDVAPFVEDRLKANFRHNSLFIGPATREAVNQGQADYTPVFLSNVPHLFRQGLIPLDVALVQTSLPDPRGFVSLGISVDITKAAVEQADLVIAQVNTRMPQTLGESFIHLKDVDFIVPHDEPLLEYHPDDNSDLAQPIGRYVARLVQDGDTIQVGYGSLPNAILSQLRHKKHLGVHTELLSDGLVALMQAGVIDNTNKTIDRNWAVATFCMGTQPTYEYIHNNPAVHFQPVDYTNNPLIIAQHDQKEE